MDMEGILMDDLLRADAEAAPPAASMSPGGAGSSSSAAATAAVGSEDESAAATDDLLRRGPWTVEEDELLVSHIAAHGEGRWNSLARTAGLRRTGKSCRLRWLNYLRPDVRRGNISAREQLLILDLHSRWGNRWSKIALHLPGRTDNEIKNYWRTRVQKHARQLRCDVGSARFRDVVRHVWMPRLVERIQAEDEAAAGAGAQAAAAEAAPVGFARLPPATTTASAPSAACQWTLQSVHRAAEDYCTYSSDPAAAAGQINTPPASSPEENSSSAPHSSLTTDASPPPHAHGGAHHHHYSSCYTTSSVSATATTTPTNNEGCGGGAVVQSGGNVTRPTAATGDDVLGGSWSELLATAGRDDGDDLIGLPDFGLFGDLEDSSLWSLEDLCLHQLC